MGIRWKKHFKITKIERQAKMHSFQYSILYSFFPCNLYLSRWKDDVSSECNNCHTVDDICHYFFRCNEVLDFWQQCNNWLNDSIEDLDQMIHLQCKDVILGVLEPKIKADVINFVILQAKWYIFRKRNNNEKIIFKEFEHVLQYRLQIEEYLYRVKDKIDIFQDIFSDIIQK